MLEFVDDALDAVHAKKYADEDVAYINLSSKAWASVADFKLLDSSHAEVNCVQQIDNGAWDNVPRAFAVVMRDGSWFKYISRAKMHPDDRHWMHCKPPVRASKPVRA